MLVHVEPVKFHDSSLRGLKIRAETANIKKTTPPMIVTITEKGLIV